MGLISVVQVDYYGMYMFPDINTDSKSPLTVLAVIGTRTNIYFPKLISLMCSVSKPFCEVLSCVRFDIVSDSRFSLPKRAENGLAPESVRCQNRGRSERTSKEHSH